MRIKDFEKVAKRHKQWLEGRKGGKRANLRGLSKVELDFSGKDFSYANIRNMGLVVTNFVGSKFKGANLRKADLRGTDCTNADFQGANMWGVTLWYAIFKGANLWYTKLWGSSLEQVNLVGANFYKTKIKVDTLKAQVAFTPVSCHVEYTEDLQIELTNKLLEHVYMCNIGG